MARGKCKTPRGLTHGQAKQVQPNHSIQALQEQTETHLLPMINGLVLAAVSYEYTSPTAFEFSTNLVKMMCRNSQHGGYEKNSSASRFRRCSSIKSWKFDAGNKDQQCKSIKMQSLRTQDYNVTVESTGSLNTHQ